MLNESNVYEATRNFVSAMSDVCKDFRVDQNAFCRAVRRLEDNTLAQTFYTAECPSGLWSHDFDSGLSMAQSACLGYHMSPEFTHFHISISGRAAKRFLGGSPEEARELAQVYIEELQR